MVLTTRVRRQNRRTKARRISMRIVLRNQQAAVLRRFTRSTRIAVMLVTVAAMSACASLGMAGFREPIVSFKDVKVRGLGLSGGSPDAYFSLHKPNGFRLDARRAPNNVLVGQNQLGTGALNSRFTVQNGDSTTVRIPIDFTYAGIGSAPPPVMPQGAG